MLMTCTISFVKEFTFFVLLLEETLIPSKRYEVVLVSTLLTG